MSKYTTELRYICEEAAGVNNHEEMSDNPGYSDTASIIETARVKLFDFSYPIFDVNYKATLETKIIKHYYFREIGAESYGQFKMWLDRRMNEIMPYYNQLYQSELLKFNPFYNSERAVERNTVNTHDVSSESVSDGVAFNESRNKSETETKNKDKVKGTDTTTDASDHWTAFSETPQGGLTGIENNQYLTNATHNWANEGSNVKVESESEDEFEGKVTGNSQGVGKTQTSSTSGNNEVYTGNGKYLEYVLGKEGTETYSEMLEKYRKTFLNIDMMVIDRLSDLFFNLW